MLCTAFNGNKMQGGKCWKYKTVEMNKLHSVQALFLPAVGDWRRDWKLEGRKVQFAGCWSGAEDSNKLNAHQRLVRRTLESTRFG